MRRLLWLALVLAALPGWAATCSKSGPPATPTSPGAALVLATQTSAPTLIPVPPAATPDAGTATPDAETDTELAAPDDPSAPPVAAAPAAVVLPDASLTPGDAFPVGAAQICVSGYSSSVRNVSSSTKNAVYAEYHIYSRSPGQYEVDHLIPLELGGSNDIKNLWPQPAEPRPGFHEKDRLENKLHALVCAGTVDLAVAQHSHRHGLLLAESSSKRTLANLNMTKKQAEQMPRRRRPHRRATSQATAPTPSSRLAASSSASRRRWSPASLPRTAHVASAAGLRAGAPRGVGQPRAGRAGAPGDR